MDRIKEIELEIQKLLDEKEKLQPKLSKRGRKLGGGKYDTGYSLTFKKSYQQKLKQKANELNMTDNEIIRSIIQYFINNDIIYQPEETTNIRFRISSNMKKKMFNKGGKNTTYTITRLVEEFLDDKIDISEVINND